ncbi:xanthine dehydrogenase [Pelagivirga sediminicola]|uniref:Xanthine dehydrogenase n=1 Tax=Pelagivirga sediminicola TaxID=2170575 RepID=A0A2T7GB04_9RHOB|nr:xanthine dehydrogenase family protein molybdopterin-binding subunit [Pelagivirga sediminicola]PVA11589.1 xanthine dehydrogenase [Pelagivirga sediminicola]
MSTGFRPHHSHHLLRGGGQYCDDIALPGALRAVFRRSDVAAGRISDLEIAAALDMPGVRAVHTGADVAHLGALPVNEVLPLEVETAFPILAQGQVHAVGQPVAAVLAPSRAQAQDGAEAILLDIDAAAPEAPRRIAGRGWHAGDAAAQTRAAAHVVKAHLQHARLAPLPLEPRGIAVRPEPDGTMTIWHATQTPHRTRTHLAQILGMDAARLRVIAPDVGGAFGMKASLYPEEVYCVWAAQMLGVPVRWSATRSEEFLSATHGRGLHTQGTLALDGDGDFTALTAQVTAPVGHWLPGSALIPAWNAARVLPGPYGIDAVDIETAAMAENLAPTGIYRGAGRPEAAALMERLVDKAARATGLDPFEIRLRNLPAKGAFPRQTATGQTLDSGDYAGLLDLLRRVSNHDARAREIARRRAAGELVGLGLALFLEPSGEGWESARVTWRASGRVEVASGSSAQGQARARSYAAIAAQILQVPPQEIDVRFGDTATCSEGIGAVASRSTPIGGSAVKVACQALREARDAGAKLPLSEEIRYETGGQAWGAGAYLVQISINADTGTPRIEAAICVDDAGTVIDAQAVADQIVGGFAQGLGEAMMEAVRYDADGQLLTASLMDYAVPRADDMPPLQLAGLQTPSPMNALGAKGVGEAGTIGAPAAILNAALDALAPLGVEDLQMPLSPARLWQAMTDARKKGPTP